MIFSVAREKYLPVAAVEFVPEFQVYPPHPGNRKAPFYLLLSMSDGADSKEKKDEIARSYVYYIDEFFRKYFS